MSKTNYLAVRFGDVAREVTESTRSPLEDGFEYYIGMEHLDPESLKIRRWGLIAEDNPTFTRIFRAGQVLFGRRRAYQRKAALAEFDGICSGDIIVTEARSDKLLPELLPFIVQTEGFYEHALSTSAGSLSPRTKWSALAKYEFPLPPLDEQRRIAEILWAVEDAIEAYLDVMYQTEFAHQAYIAQYVKHYKETGDLVSLNDVIDKERPICYGILKPGNHFEGGIPVIKVKDYPNGVILEEGLLYTNPEIDAQYKRSKLKTGDLLLSIRGTMGRVADVPSSLDGANITQDTVRITVASDHNPNFIRSILTSPFLQQQITRAITGNAVQGINVGEVRKLLLPLPNRSEQNRVAEITQQFLCSSLDIEAHIENLKQMKQSVLSKYL